MTGAKQLDIRLLSALLLVPLVMVVTDVAADQTGLKFLLLPPFGALTYLLFVNPARVRMTLRRVVICPDLTAVLAWVVANTLGYNALSVAIVTVGTIALMWALDARMVVPPLALALLTILLHDEVRGKVAYIISVFVFTAVVYAIHRLWLRLPFPSPPEGPAPGEAPAPE